MRGIATVVGRSVATVSRLLAGLGLSSLKVLDPVQPVGRYERAAPGELLRMDTKKLGRIVRPGHRVTGDRRDSVEGAGWEFAHVAVDDHSRAGFRADASGRAQGVRRGLPKPDEPEPNRQKTSTVVRKIVGRSTDLRYCKCSRASREKCRNPVGLEAFCLWRLGRWFDFGTLQFFSQIAKTQLVSD